MNTRLARASEVRGLLTMSLAGSSFDFRVHLLFRIIQGIDTVHI